MKKILALSLILFSAGSAAGPAWYYGKIARIWHYDSDGFILTFDSSALDNCKNKYVYFQTSIIGENQKSSSYSMALSAFHAQNTVGVVIDKSLHGEFCRAKSIDMGVNR